MDKKNILIVILASCLGFSILLNLYYIFSLKTPSSFQEPSHQVSVGVTDLQWTQYPQEQTDVYYVEVSFKLTNYGDVSAFTIVSFKICRSDSGQVLYEWFKTGEDRGVGNPIVRYGYFVVPPNKQQTYHFDFSYISPDNIPTFLKAEVTEVIPME